MKTPAMGNRQLFYGLLLAPVFLLGLLSIIATGGGGGDDDGDVTPQGQVTVAGVVSGSGGLIDVTVSSGGKSTTTDANGFYELAGIPVPANDPIVLTYEKDGYATFQRSLSVADGETYAVAASLLQYHHNESMDAAQSNDLTVVDPNNVSGPSLAELSFPAGSVAGSGNVTVEVAVGDPTTEAGRPTFPGDYMAASTAGGDADTPLESVVFTEITVTDASGTELTQLNEPATVTVRLPDALQSQYAAGNKIPWWSYDETTATWVREDADPATAGVVDDAQVIDLNGNGVLYAQAKVTHFTWWNVDQPITQHACLCANVQGGDDAPMVGSQLIAEGVSYNGMSRPARTDATGKACVTIKRSTANVAERIKLYIESGGVRFYYDVTDASEGDVGSNEIFTPTTEGSTIYNTGQCVDLANVIAQRYDGVVNGIVTYEVSGNPVANFTILSDFGPTASTNADGQYSINVPVGVPVSLFAVGLVSQSVTVADANTPVTVDFVVPNRAPVITGLTRVPEGAVVNNQTVTLSVTASDPEGDGLSYAWSTTVGSLNQTTGTSVVWTAPATSSGTAQVTVTVSDAGGEESSQTVSIVYNEPVQTGDRLSFIIKDDPRSNLPRQGITVALYNTDNKTIKETKVSDASGVVDFGDIGRSRASVTIAYEDDNTGERYIETFVDSLVAENIVYYLDDTSTTFGDLDIYREGYDPDAYINLSLSSVPAGAVLSQFQPTWFAFWNHSSGFGQLSTIPVMPAHLQDDGKLSLLASTYGDATASSLIGYGYLLDQTVPPIGASYDIALNRAPLTLGWTTSPATGVHDMGVFGFRGGVWYLLTADMGATATSGALPYAAEFPVDKYYVYGDADTRSSNGAVLSSLTRHDTLPQSVQIPMPDYSVSSVVYTEATKTFSWTVSGSTPRDVVNLDMSGLGQLERRIEWWVTMPEDATSWQVMDLPAPADEWVDTANILSNIYRIELDVCDLDFVSGRDELTQFLIGGGSMVDSTQQLYCGGNTFSGTVTATSKTSTADPAHRGMPGLLGKGLGHLRRR